MKKKLHVDRVIAYNWRILKKKMNNNEDTYNLFPKMKLTTQIKFLFNNE